MMDIKFSKEQSETIEDMESMMESCFCYGGLEKDSYNFNKYLSPYKERLPEPVFWIVYNNKKQSLELNYEVLPMTSQDSEGNWYNTLIRK